MKSMLEKCMSATGGGWKAWWILYTIPKSEGTIESSREISNKQGTRISIISGTKGGDFFLIREVGRRAGCKRYGTVSGLVFSDDRGDTYQIVYFGFSFPGSRLAPRRGHHPRQLTLPSAGWPFPMTYTRTQTRRRGRSRYEDKVVVFPAILTLGLVTWAACSCTCFSEPIRGIDGICPN